MANKLLALDDRFDRDREIPYQILLQYVTARAFTQSSPGDLRIILSA